jgi:adenylate cyclase
MIKLLILIRRNIALLWDRIGLRFRNNFYLYAAVIFTLLAVVDMCTVRYVIGMRNTSFDTMVKYRFKVPKPSPDVVIADIDEKSLAAMAPEFGRWPWPRQVLGEFVEKITAQKPKAIVFDILFSDPDVYNNESDAYFNEVVAKTGNLWFPMIRLPRTADGESKLRVSMIPGARTLGPVVDTTATIAVILPFFDAAQRSGRMGFNNIKCDPDGISREYPVRYREHGYEIPSLPWAVAAGEHGAAKVPDRILLNWRGKPFTYKHISFSDLFADLRKEHPQRPGDEFTGKIVIIGSTAPSLFDLKVTAVDRQFPGVEVLATAIDNLRRGDWLRVPEMPFVYFLITLAILWITAVGFYRRGAGGHLDRFYGLSQFILIGIAYTAINLFDLYLNLTGPVMFGFAFYSIARYYSFATARALDPSIVRVASGDGAVGYLVALHFDLDTREEALLAKLGDLLVKRCAERPSAEWLCGRQRGFWRLFENTLFLCWSAESRDDQRLVAIRSEAEGLCNSLKTVLHEKPMDGALPFEKLTVTRAEGGIGSGEHGDWRLLMGTALLRHEGGTTI